MRNLLLITLLLIVSNITFAQGFADDFTISGKAFSIKSTQLKSGGIEVEITNSSKPDKKESFRLNGLKLSAFNILFKEKLNALKSDNDNLLETEILRNSERLFYKIVANSLVKNEEGPTIGELTISEEVILYKYDYNGDKGKKITTQKDNTNGEIKVKITEIEIGFNEGFIQTIKINGDATIDGNVKNYRFENIYGIGFSSKKNFDDMYNTRLFNYKNGSRDNDAENYRYFIYLGDAIDYDYTVSLNTYDYSPRNQVIYSTGGEKVTLRKEQTSKLFEMIIYSDLLGINEENPNGLIQIEIDKRINTNTYRRDVNWRLRDWGLITGFGLLQYVKPSITISKIEENSRYLTPVRNDIISFNSVDTTYSLETKSGISPLNTFNYQSLILGNDFNFLFFENSKQKFDFHINGGFRFGRTMIRDSVRTLSSANLVGVSKVANDFGVNYFMIYPEFILNWQPEERFSLTFTDRINYFTPAFTDLELIEGNNNSIFNSTVSNRWLNTFEIVAAVKVGDNGRLFGRWRFHYELGNINENFHQLQAGYSFYFLSKNKK